MRILCFGDSNTLGLQPTPQPSHSYSLALHSRLTQRFPHANVTVETSGHPARGALGLQGVPLSVTLKQDLERSEYDVVVIMVGTNDLAASTEGNDKAFSALQELWAMCRAKGAKVVAMTLLEFHIPPQYENYRQGFLYFNDRVRAAGESGGVIVYDLTKAFPRWRLTEEQVKDLFWDDDHATVKGYDQIGAGLADAPFWDDLIVNS